ncbi:MAG: ATP-binding protein [Verrucomicrobiota bacterium]
MEALDTNHIKDRNSILIIDDDVKVSRVFSFALSGTYHVSIANTLRDGLLHIYQSKPHLVILDMCLPDQVGLSGLKQIHDYDAEIPVLVLTGYPNYDDAVQALRRGALNYLEKPIRPKYLLDCVSKAIRKSRRPTNGYSAQTDAKQQSDSETIDLIHDLSNGLTTLEFSVYSQIQQNVADKPDIFLATLLGQVEYINRLLEHWRDREIDKALGDDPAPLKELVHAAKETVALLHHRDGIEIVWNHRAVDDDVIVGIPVIPFGRILTNLLENAAAAMDEMAGKRRLSIQFRIKQQRCLILVSDNGKGISPENMKKLFCKHWTTKQEKRHHGMGLLLLERLVKTHDGTVCFTSTEGQGTTFVVNLPLE